MSGPASPKIDRPLTATELRARVLAVLAATNGAGHPNGSSRQVKKR